MAIIPSQDNWINFLIAERNRIHNWLMADISSILIILTIYIALFSYFGVHYSNIIMFPIYIYFILIVNGINKTKKELKKTNSLLKDILKRKLESIEEIEDRWFLEEDKMLFSYNSGFKAFFGLGVIFIFIGLVFAGLAVYKSFSGEIGVEADFGFNFFTGGLGLISIGIAIHSVDIGKKSDDKMKSFATGDFHNLENEYIKNLYIIYNNKSNEVDRNTQSWHLLNYFQHGEAIKKWVKPNLQKQLTNRFNDTLRILKQNNITIYQNEVRNYIEIAKIALKFKTDDEVKNKMIDRLGGLIGKKGNEGNESYLIRKEQEIPRERGVFNITP